MAVAYLRPGLVAPGEATAAIAGHGFACASGELESADQPVAGRRLFLIVVVEQPAASRLRNAGLVHGVPGGFGLQRRSTMSA
jgi:hypothetical protein